MRKVHVYEVLQSLGELKFLPVKQVSILREHRTVKSKQGVLGSAALPA